MADKKQTTDYVNGDKVAGTGYKTLTPRPYSKGTARHDNVGGVSGENATEGNRNVRS